MAIGTGLPGGAPPAGSAYCAKVIATAARPPPWIMRSEDQPKRNPTSGW